jgi:hypothetical protein
MATSAIVQREPPSAVLLKNYRETAMVIPICLRVTLSLRINRLFCYCHTVMVDHAASFPYSLAPC